MSSKQQICPVFLKLPPERIALLKFTLESYEGLGILRTINPDRGEVVILAIADTLADVKSMLRDLKDELQFQEIERPECLKGDWLLETEL